MTGNNGVAVSERDKIGMSNVTYSSPIADMEINLPRGKDPYTFERSEGVYLTFEPTQTGLLIRPATRSEIENTIKLMYF